MVNGTLLDIVERLDPLCRVDGDILLQEAVENILDIADQWDRRSKVFADLSGIDIDVDDVRPAVPGFPASERRGLRSLRPR